MGISGYEFMPWAPDGDNRRVFGPRYWSQPFEWDKSAREEGSRKRVAISSLTEVFEVHPQITGERVQLWALIHSTPNLDYVISTRRLENVLRMIPQDWTKRGWPANVWLGTTIENQEHAEERIPVLMRLPARLHFLSCDPLRELVDLSRFFWWFDGHGQPKPGWVIIGGDYGHLAAPLSLDWVVRIVGQARMAGVPAYINRLGSKPLVGNHRLLKLKDASGSDWGEWPEHMRVRQWPASPTAIPAAAVPA